MSFSKKLIAAAVAVVAVAAGTTAFAAIPDGGGAIHGCYDKQSGTLRVTDTATNSPKACTNKEAALDWSQRGPQGIPGDRGPKGDSGISQGYVWTSHTMHAIGPNSAVGGMSPSMPDPALISAKVEIGTTDNAAVVTCTLYSGPDPIDTSSATVYSPNGAAWTTLYMVGKATHSNVNVWCGVANNGFVRNVVLTATEVNSLYDLS